MPLSSGFCSFWWEIHCHSNCFSPIGSIASFWLFSRYFLCLGFQKFNDDVSWHEFLQLYPVWSLSSFLNLWFCFSFQIWLSFQALFLWVPFQLHSFSFLSGFQLHSLRSLAVVSQFHQALSFFFPRLFSLCCSDSLLCPFHSAVEPIQWALLCWDFLFYFHLSKHICNCIFKNFYHGLF